MTTLSEAGAPGPAAASLSLPRSTLRHSGPRCAVLALVAMAATGANLSLPLALGRALDLLLAGDPGASRRVLWCAGLVLAVAALDAVETVLAGTTSARSTAWLRHRTVGHVLAVGPRAVGRFGPGDLVARLVGNAAQAGTAPATVAALLAALAGPLGAVVALGLIDPFLAVVFLVGAPLLALLLRALARDSSDCVARYQRAQGRIAGGLAEAVAGHRTIAAAGIADRTVARVLGPLPELSREGHRMWRVQGRAAARAAAVAPLLQLSVVATAGVLVTRDRLSVGELLAASRYAVLAAGIGVLVGLVSGLVRGRAGSDRLAEILAEAPTAYGERLLPPPGQGAPEGRLELRSVTVRRGGRAVLDGVDLVVPGGTTLAVVGRSGAGKSLLAAVAGRLTDPDEGEVRLDGCPCPNWTAGSCAGRSPTPSNARPCWASPWRTPSPSVSPGPPPPASGKPPAPRTPTPSSGASPTATPPRAPTPPCRAGRSNASVSPGRSPATAVSSCSTTRSPASTPSPNATSPPRCCAPPAAAA